MALDTLKEKYDLGMLGPDPSMGFNNLILRPIRCSASC